MEYNSTPNHKRNGNAVVYHITHDSGIDRIEVGIKNVQSITGHWPDTIHKCIRTGEASSSGWKVKRLGRVSQYYIDERKECNDI